MFLVESANYHVKNGVVFGNYTFRTIAIESFSDNYGAVPLPPPLLPPQ
jgi:predicted methyltransferase MtxX (methanogen marker protein 4)